LFFSEFMMFDRTGNSEVTPMAQLTSIGRTLIDKAILGVTLSAASYAAGGVAHTMEGANKMDHLVGQVGGLAGSMTMTIALIGLSSGFVLYYMLPLLPFIYFFFAVGRWVKVVFEALVGVPLWALAHMRVGGPGLPGGAAIGGYFLLLEIFIRPILTVFSLVGAFALFSGLVSGLNSIFLMASANVMGSAAPTATGMSAMAIELTRGMMDQFFLSIFYIALVYTIGTGCFKLIDILPDNIMRWSGSGAQSMAASDVSDDMIEQWQWELPQRFNSTTGTLGRGMREALYGEGERAHGAFKKAEKLKEAEEKAKQESKQGNIQ
jgi:conjugal transfer/type IV secretion protein DotA/TraY